MSATAEPLILATGFSVFPGAPENPTAWAIGELEREHWTPQGTRLITRVLPVRYDIWPDIAEIIDRHRPDAVIGFGLSAKATGFTLESTARNQLGHGRPDAAGTLATSAHLSDGGRSTYPSRLPLREIEAALKQADLPVALSGDAGDYICNLFFYRLMTHAAEHATPRIGGFIHVPYLDEQLPRLTLAGLQTDHLKTLTKAQLLSGVRIALTTIASALKTSVR